MATPVSSTDPKLANWLSKVQNTSLPLTRAGRCQEEIGVLGQRERNALVAHCRFPHAALSGLLLCMGCWEESHHVSQDDSSAEGSYWHALAHRVEPDTFNAGYWFRRVGQHAIFAAVQESASSILAASHSIHWQLRGEWDPIVFLKWCDEARGKPHEEQHRVATAIHNAECRRLLDWCVGLTGQTHQV